MLTNTKHKNFYNIGVSYVKADAKTRGKFSLSKEDQISLLEEAKSMGFDGIFVLSTCNRTEISGFASRPCLLIELLCKYSQGTVEEFRSISTIQQNQEAVNHLFRMGTGLESQILGDYEIVGQLKMAVKQAKEVGTINAYIERLINLVLQSSKRVKNETKLSSGTTSVSYAAVQYLIKNLPDYNSKNILVYGLGKMGKHTCKNLAQYTQNKQVALVNRTEEKVDEFIKDYDFIKKAKLENLTSEIENTDVLIVSTGASTATITKENITSNKDLLVLDLSVPANVSEEVKQLDNITLINVDELSKVTDETLAVRKQEVPVAEAIISEHKQEFNEWLNHRRFTPAINALKQSLEAIQQDEINFHKKKISNFDIDQAEAITSRFIQKITTQFVKHLKEENTSVNQSIQVMAKVFGTNLETIDAKNN
ncbi:glutamyl-tRNA reductase [Tenacibaculum jejuense]|uniref:Glutamyl-tRNA reductase n=1 Tax=Tenacibaculum jejuense TaxID=584609 RepID=A0A238U888_9FLAO|nr:glutamyl-tRNA reductase [Tenacibaculum jejuense]SNR15401.1 Glutamyl-tRNA reductase [Tenacibaculum jejuense]